MLQLKNISKQYTTGALIQQALDDVSLSFRDSEFVSILGPSGSGKTTLLNVIGGLDRYDSGDLVINGISTKEYRDRDWDAYRNHTVGFVFQSYNLIPHQSILSNVELALTIAGLPRAERVRRARQALEDVGLGDQLHKRPSQMSGGQMQRVAIARALVNDPGILLADEPTGALDSETSVQVMELLKQVAKDRLVVMVTHNSELAEAYSTRIVRLRDGKVIDDSDPFDPEEAQNLPEPENRSLGRAKMSFLTALSLSFNNLRTKRGRTLLTAFAGSIGIIGIALILALSSGMNTYINSIQKDTMTSYPITISAEALNFDMVSVMGMRRQMMMSREKTEDWPAAGVHADHSGLEDSERLSASVTENDLTAFKRYLDNPDSEIQQYLGENGVVYTYNVKFEVFSYDPNGSIVNSNAEPEDSSAASPGGFAAMMNGGGMSFMMGGTSGIEGAENFSELMAGSGGTAVSAVITDSYEILCGAWPERYDEVILVLDENNAVPTESLYQLGLITGEEFKRIAEQVKCGEQAEDISLDYETVCGHTLYLVPACDRYEENEDGVFTYIDDGSLQVERLLENSLELKIVGIVRPAKDAANASIPTAVAYTSGLTRFLIEHTDESAVVMAQQTDPDVNVLNGMSFDAMDDAQKIEDAKTYVFGLGISDKASLYHLIVYYQMQNADEAGAGTENGGQPGPQEGESPMGAGGGMSMDETAMAAATDRWLEETPDDEILLSIYDEYIDGASYQANMRDFGKVSYDAPDSISIYTDSFEAKEAVAECIANYNRTVEDDKQIAYTDYVELMTSSLTSIINVISYVLVAFVAVSLVVSCLMIGVITHISVLERTKEIGILRALGASKENISQVFNAETLIIGLCAGLLGISLSVLLTVPVNAVIQGLLDADSLTVSLSVGYAAALVGVSVVITVIGGLFPARKAAKKDPVIALRAE